MHTPIIITNSLSVNYYYASWAYILQLSETIKATDVYSFVENLLEFGKNICTPIVERDKLKN